MKPQPAAPVPRVALTREEAAASLGVSLSHFERHIQPELRLIYSGSTRLVPLRELERWADRAATWQDTSKHSGSRDAPTPGSPATGI